MRHGMVDGLHLAPGRPDLFLHEVANAQGAAQRIPDVLLDEVVDQPGGNCLSPVAVRVLEGDPEAGAAERVIADGLAHAFQHPGLGQGPAFPGVEVEFLDERPQPGVAGHQRGKPPLQRSPVRGRDLSRSKDSLVADPFLPVDQSAGLIVARQQQRERHRRGAARIAQPVGVLRR
jgi:hypothetical protein